MYKEVINELKILDSNPRYKAEFLLLLRSNGFLTSEELAEKLGVSSRTIKSDLKCISNSLCGEAVKIVAKRSKGAMILIENDNLKNMIKCLFSV